MFRCVINRVSRASVFIDGVSQGDLGQGLLLLFGVGATAALPAKHTAGLEKLADKICGLRIFSDPEGKMNLSVRDVAGGIYVVSQFTLFADCKKGMRPSFTGAAGPVVANAHYESFLELVRQRMGALQVFSGKFGADMKLDFVNDGPVTIVLGANSEGVL